MAAVATVMVGGVGLIGTILIIIVMLMLLGRIYTTEAVAPRCPLLALSGHPRYPVQRPLSGGKADMAIALRNVCL